VSLTPLLAAAALSAVLSWLIVALVRDAALRRGLLDVPNARSSHARPTPRLGGLGIMAAVLASVGAGIALGIDPGALPLLLGIAAVVGGLSLVDDLRGLPALARLAVHVAAAAAIMWAVGGFEQILIILDHLRPGSVIVGVSAAVAAGLWIVWIAGFVNAFNFMDGIDGIAGVQAAAAGVAWLAIGWFVGEPALALLGTSMAAACLGFLLHNWSPASIFMGDVGSAFLGILLATAPLAARMPRGLLVPAMLTVWPFVFDTALTLVRRAARRENLLAAHRSHLYQRLTQAGWSHGQVATLYGTLAAGGAVLALAVAIEAVGAPAAFAAVAMAGIALWGLVLRVERQQDGGTAASIADSSRA
jgi:UDP-N-acetylmuramyl pentapeptide phosphotransferase/UDP-N-acetylglucosamine-1-phosphate transferase